MVADGQRQGTGGRSAPRSSRSTRERSGEAAQRAARRLRALRRPHAGRGGAREHDRRGRPASSPRTPRDRPALRGGRRSRARRPSATSASAKSTFADGAYRETAGSRRAPSSLLRAVPQRELEGSDGQALLAWALLLVILGGETSWRAAAATLERRRRDRARARGRRRQPRQVRGRDAAGEYAVRDGRRPHGVPRARRGGGRVPAGARRRARRPATRSTSSRSCSGSGISSTASTSKRGRDMLEEAVSSWPAARSTASSTPTAARSRRRGST